MVAEIEPPHLPIHLYRYRSLKGGKDIVEREIATITENYLWCSEFTKLNDPMEEFYKPSNVLVNGRNANIIKQNILDSKSNIGIASLKARRISPNTVFSTFVSCLRFDAKSRFYPVYQRLFTLR
jgi:hypothetical protein